ncbi:MAG: hypothetical protein HY394_00695 [Candidatus Diapherotrites archaeon]|nr:hypothetical protein [Candidatus Diapherotrites archaeon]
MVVSIMARFHPLRLKVSRREPVELELTLANDGKAKKLSVDIALGLGLSFQRGGFKTNVMERLDAIGPNESKTLFYQIWPKHDVRFGEMPIRIRVLEHGESFAQILKQDIAEESLIVEE